MTVISKNDVMGLLCIRDGKQTETESSAQTTDGLPEGKKKLCRQKGKLHVISVNGCCEPRYERGQIEPQVRT